MEKSYTIFSSTFWNALLIIVNYCQHNVEWHRKIFCCYQLESWVGAWEVFGAGRREGLEGGNGEGNDIILLHIFFKSLKRNYLDFPPGLLHFQISPSKS